MNNPFRILLVDDDADDREIFCDTMIDIDSTTSCTTAFDGFDAFEVLYKSTNTLPDVIFLDLNLPRLSGKQFLSQLREHPVFKTIPVVIYTTSRSLKDMDDTRAMGAIEFLTKPTRSKDLTMALSNIMEQLLYHPEPAANYPS